MNINQFLRPSSLERNSFLWSQARLVIAAVALFLGGVPPLLYFVRIPALFGLFGTLLKLAWLVSGAASLYLAYRWNANRRMLFGGTDRKDMAAFAVSVLSGVNLGLVGLLGNNIGMSIASGTLVFWVTGLVYLASAAYLFKRWKEYGRRLF